MPSQDTSLRMCMASWQAFLAPARPWAIINGPPVMQRQNCMLSWQLNVPPNAYSTPSPGPQGWTGWVCYNDETPAGSDASGTKFAHAKGILACEWAQPLH